MLPPLCLTVGKALVREVILSVSHTLLGIVALQFNLYLIRSDEIKIDSHDQSHSVPSRLSCVFLEEMILVLECTRIDGHPRGRLPQ